MAYFSTFSKRICQRLGFVKSLRWVNKLAIKSPSNTQFFQLPSEEQLDFFNGKPLAAVNDSLMIGADKTISCLFLGNSITYHSVIEEEPAEGKRGLTATSVEKDYVHILLKTISEEKHVNIKFSIVNIAQFERTFTTHGFEIGVLDLVENKHPDFLFVQIGENVAKEDIKDTALYENEYRKLLALFPNSK